MAKQIELDEDFLLNYIAQGGKAETPTGNVVSPDNVDDFLRDAVASPNKGSQENGQNVQRGGSESRGSTDTTRLRAAEPQARESIDKSRAEERAARAEDSRQQREADRQRKQDAADEASQRKGQGDTIQAISNIANPVIDRGKAISDRIGAIRTVGGIGLLLFVLFVLLFTVVQVGPNGTTRLKQLWYLLTFRAELQGKKMLALPIPNKEDVGADATQLLTAIAQVGNDELASIGIAATQAFNSVEQAATQPVSDIASFIGNLGSDIASTFRITP